MDIQRVTGSLQKCNCTIKPPLPHRPLNIPLKENFGGHTSKSLCILRPVRTTLLCYLVQVFASLLHCFSLTKKQNKKPTKKNPTPPLKKNKQKNPRKPKPQKNIPCQKNPNKHNTHTHTKKKTPPKEKPKSQV